MTIRERLTAALRGETPDVTPLSIYGGWIDFASEAGRRLREQGLGEVAHCSTVRSVEHGVEYKSEEWRKGETQHQVHRLKTPVGELRSVYVNGWQTEWYIKEPADYRIIQWVVEHTELSPAFEEYARADEAVGEHGVAVITPPRTPAMTINLDWAGTERFCTDIALEVPELLDLYEAAKALFLEHTRLVAAGPGEFVDWFENLTVRMLGRERYRRLLMPLYEICVPSLAASGKRVLVHYDGALSSIADLIAQTPLHGIESLTEPPEGDMTYDQCRAAWPDKCFWGNLNLGCYRLSPEQLKQAVIEKRQRAGRRGFAFEISEDLPPNWESTIPVVLNALQELG